MKRILIISFIISCLFILVSCNKETVYNFSPIAVFETTVFVSFNEDNGDYKLSKEDANNYYNEIKKELNELNRITDNFSSNENNTSIYDLNEKRSIEVSDKLIDVINYSVKLIEDTNGYFNPFMGKVNKVWKDFINDKDQKELPNDDLIKELINEVNNTSVSIKDNLVTINGNGDIDLGGVVKGYALEWIRSYLDSKNVKNYLIQCSASSIYVSGIEKTVAISKPYNSGYVKNVTIKNQGIATSSGEYQNKVIDGRRYHHLINPFTGYPGDLYESISVIGDIDNGLLDAYSTAIFNMEYDDIVKFAKDKNLNIIIYDGNESKEIN